MLRLRLFRTRINKKEGMSSTHLDKTESSETNFDKTWVQSETQINKFRVFSTHIDRSTTV